MSSDRESADRLRYAELKALFSDAVERPPEDWPALLASLRQRDADLADGLQRLLDGHVESLIQIRPPRPEHLEPGAVLGPYVVTGLLGEGGMGQVYRARDARLGRDVAIKVLPPDLAHDSGRRVRMEREALAMGMLNHPNIVTVYDIGDHHGSPFIVSELLEGETLRERVAADPDHRLDARMAVGIIASVADALGAAHRRGIVHRDVKPENVFLTSDGRVKVLDFGIAKLVDGQVGEGTAVGLMIGTLGYMAPEQLRGDAIGAPTDVYACGVLLYELLSGARPFAGRSQPATIAAILNEQVPALSGVPPALSALVARCLDKSPAARFADGAELAAASRAITDFPSATDVARRDASTLRLQEIPPAPRRPGTFRRPALLVALAIVLLAGVAAGVVFWRQSRGGSIAETSPPAATPGVGVPAPVPSPSTAPSAPPETRPEPTPSPRLPRSTSAPRREEKSTTAPSEQGATSTASPQQPAAAPAPAPPSIVGVWTFSEQVREDVHAIECTASGSLQVRSADGLLDGTLTLQQNCKDTKRQKAESTEAAAALTAGSIAADAVSFVTRIVDAGTVTTCRYAGKVVGTARPAMTGEVTCVLEAAASSQVLTLRGDWRAFRP